MATNPLRDQRWAHLQANPAYAVNPLDNAAFGTAQQFTDSVGGIGSASGNALLSWGIPGADALNTDPAYADNPGSPIDPRAVQAWLQQNGYTLYDKPNGQSGTKYAMDASGNIVGTPYDYFNEDDNFWTGAMLAGALAGSAAGGAFSGGGGLGAGSGVSAYGGVPAAELSGYSGGAIGGAGGLAAGGAEGLSGAGVGGGSVAPAVEYTGWGAGSGGGGLGASQLAGGTGLGAAGGTAGGMAGGGAAGGGLGSMLTSNYGLGQLGSAAIGLYGNQKAIGAMQDATNQANNLAQQQLDYTKEINAPLVGLRNSVLPRINALLQDPSSITQEPGYQFGLKQGADQLNNRAAASGSYYSGGQMKAAQRYGQDYAGTKLDQSLNRLTTVAGLGQVGANNAQQGMTQGLGSMAGNTLNMGNARGSLYGGNAQIVGNALGSIFNDQQYRQMWGNP